MKLLTLYILPLFFINGLLAQGSVENSNLPILIISTNNGQPIPDEPKIDAHLGIIWNGVNSTNNINGDFNHYNGKIAVEKRGSSSQALFPKVGYTFETRNADNSNNNISLLGMPAENDWVLHGPYSDKSLMRNALAYTMADWIMDYAPRVRYCEVVVNDDYRGVYILTEKIKRDKYRVDISTLNPDENTGDDLTGGYILKFDKYDGAGYDGFLSQYPSFDGGGFNTFFQYHYPKYDEISTEQKNYIQRYIQEVENTLKSDNFSDETTGYRKQIDLPSFMQFLFIQEIGRNVDGYRLSTFFYKDKDSVNGKLKFGPVWDFNLAFGNVDYCTGPGTIGWALDFNDVCPDDYWVIHFWWDRIWEDPAFIEEMKAYWKLLRSAELTNERILHLVDSLDYMLQAPAERNFERWPVLGERVWPNFYVGNTYQQEVGYLRQWVIDRLGWMDRAMDLLGEQMPDPSEFIQPETLPNPFRNTLTFKYYCQYQENVKIEIYNAQGQQVEIMTDQSPAAGLRTTEWIPNVPNGLYFYRMKFSRGEVATGVVVKS